MLFRSWASDLAKETITTYIRVYWDFRTYRSTCKCHVNARKVLHEMEHHILTDATFHCFYDRLFLELSRSPLALWVKF